jgi:hypothetical protein
LPDAGQGIHAAAATDPIAAHSDLQMDRLW